VGALVTLHLPEDSPVLNLPWIITFGPLAEDEDWEPVVSGPYERAHALALAGAVVADDDLIAVVEPLLPHVSTEEIRGEIAAARFAALSDEDDVEDGEPDDHDFVVAEDDEDEDEDAAASRREPPTEDEVRAGFERIAARLTASR
jgi:hypothetical protein